MQEDDDVIIFESSTTTTTTRTAQTVTVEIPAKSTPSKKHSSRKKKKVVADDDSSDDDVAVDPAKYGRASFSHKKRAPVNQPGKIDFCHICSQRFTITAYTKHSPDGEGLLCHKCGAVEQVEAKKDVPKRKRTNVGKGTAKMILEGKEDRIGKLQDLCIKVSHPLKMEVMAGYCESYSRC